MRPQCMSREDPRDGGRAGAATRLSAGEIFRYGSAKSMIFCHAGAATSVP